MQSFDDASFSDVPSVEMKRVLTQTTAAHRPMTPALRWLVCMSTASPTAYALSLRTDTVLRSHAPGSGFAWSVPADGMIMPSRGVDEMRKLMDGQENISIAVVGNHAVARSEDQTLCMRLTDGTFPNYEQVILKANDRHAVVDRGQLLAALRTVSVFSSLKTGQVEITFNSGALVISSVSDSGTAREESPLRLRRSGASGSASIISTCVTRSSRWRARPCCSAWAITSHRRSSCRRAMITISA